MAIKQSIEPSSFPVGSLDLVLAMAEEYATTLEELRGRRRTRDLVTVRARIAMRLKERGLTVTAIGRLLNRDHTTVLNLLNGQPAERVRRSEGQ